MSKQTGKAILPFNSVSSCQQTCIRFLKAEYKSFTYYLHTLVIASIMPIIIITGAGSGIGYSFVQAFASKPSTTIHAVDITFPLNYSLPPSSPATLIIHTVDISSPSSVSSLSLALANQPINLLIHSAGIRGLVTSILEKEKHAAPAEILAVMDAQTMMKTFQVNTLGSFLLIQCLIPNLQATAAAGEAPKVAIMGSRMGSISSNTTGAGYAYRASKAGLNALVKSFSIDVPEVVFTIIHPGRVASGLVKGVREDGAVEPEEAVGWMMELITGLGKEDSGRFYGRGGVEIPW